MDQWRSKFSESFSLDRYWSIGCSSLGWILVPRGNGGKRPKKGKIGQRIGEKIGHSPVSAISPVGPKSVLLPFFPISSWRPEIGFVPGNSDCNPCRKSLTLQPLLFWTQRRGKPRQNSEGSSLCGTPKILGKERKTDQKARESSQRKKKGKEELEGQGLSNKRDPKNLLRLFLVDNLQGQKTLTSKNKPEYGHVTLILKGLFGGYHGYTST